jgi:hypothetical protein
VALPALEVVALGENRNRARGRAGQHEEERRKPSGCDATAQ